MFGSSDFDGGRAVTKVASACFAALPHRPGLPLNSARTIDDFSTRTLRFHRAPQSMRRAAVLSMIRGFPNGFGKSSNDDVTADIPVQGSPQPKRALDELVDFPCVFTVKVVGIREVCRSNLSIRFKYSAVPLMFMY